MMVEGHNLLSTALSFIFFFVVGLGISLQPGVVMAGVHISRPLHDDGRRWIAFVVMSIVMLFGDMVITRWLTHLYETQFHDVVIQAGHIQELGFNGIVPLNEWVGALVMVIPILVLLQLLGFADFGHGERNLRFYYDQLRQELLNPSWEERYVQTHSGSILSCLVGLVYMLRAPFRASWPYVLWALWCKGIVVLLNVVLLPVLMQWLAVTGIVSTELTLLNGGVWVDTYLFAYLIMGYLCGHTLFHHGESKSRLTSPYAMWLQIIARLVVILSLFIFIVCMIALLVYGHKAL